jgi:hypothetical protein
VDGTTAERWRGGPVSAGTSGSEPRAPEGIAGGHVTPARDSAPVRGQRVVVQDFVLYAAQSWHWAPRPVENMWRGVGKRMNRKATSSYVSSGRAPSSSAACTWAADSVRRPPWRIAATATPSRQRVVALLLGNTYNPRAAAPGDVRGRGPGRFACLHRSSRNVFHAEARRHCCAEAAEDCLGSRAVHRCTAPLRPRLPKEGIWGRHSAVRGAGALLGPLRLRGPPRLRVKHVAQRPEVRSRGSAQPGSKLNSVTGDSPPPTPR